MEVKKMQYQVAYGCSDKIMPELEELEKKVKTLIQEGWKPKGGISVYTSVLDPILVCQAMGQ